MSYVNDLQNMVDDYWNNFNKYFNDNAILLNKESGDGGGNSNPQNATNAAGNFSRAADKLLTAHVSMALELGTYKDNWTGPAADAFHDVFSTLTAYFFDAAQNLDPWFAQKYGWAGAAKTIGESHDAAINIHNTNYHAAWGRYWDLIKQAKDEKIGLLAYRLDHKDDPYWMTNEYGNVFDQGLYDTEVGNFTTRRNYYSDEFGKISTNNVGSVATAMNDLSTTYTDSISMLMPPALPPQFPNNNKNTPNPNDPNNPLDSDGDGVPDYADPYPDDPTKKGPQPPEPEKDSDGDGVPDYADPYPYDPTKFGPQPPDMPNNEPPPFSGGPDPFKGPAPPSGGDIPGGGPGAGGGLPGGGGPPDGGLAGGGLPGGGGLAGGGLPDGGGLGGGGLGGGGLPDGGLAGGGLSPGPFNPGALAVPPVPEQPAPGKLVVGPDGTPGYDLTGNGIPDIGLDGQPLPNGDLPNANVTSGSNGRGSGVDVNGDRMPDVNLNGEGLPGGAAPGAQLAKGPNGLGYDVTGNRKPDLDLNGNVLRDGDLPPGTRVVTGRNGVRGLDLNGDGIPDVDFAGHALPGGAAPSGSQLSTGPDGTTGFDITHNRIPDIDSSGNPLPGGDLPPGTRVVTHDGVRGLDLNGDGIPDVDFGGRALPGGTGPVGSNLVTTVDGTTGYDINGDGIPDLDLSGNPLPGFDRGSGGVPGLRAGDQVTMGPGFPGQPVSSGAGGGLAATAPPGPAPSFSGGDALTAGRGMGGPMMPPMMPPQMGGQQKNERETWLQEEDDVWTGDDARVPVATLGRPGTREEDEDLPDSAWEEEAPVKAPAPRGGPRSNRPPAGAPQRGSRR